MSCPIANLCVSPHSNQNVYVNIASLNYFPRFFTICHFNLKQVRILVQQLMNFFKVRIGGKRNNNVGKFALLNMSFAT